MAHATARHILVDTEEACQKLKDEIEAGAGFRRTRGPTFKLSLGKTGRRPRARFSPGQMVPEFDRVVFNEKVGQVHGPVKTQFGYHLLEITSRMD